MKVCTALHLALAVAVAKATTNENAEILEREVDVAGAELFAMVSEWRWLLWWVRGAKLNLPVNPSTLSLATDTFSARYKHQTVTT